MIVIVLALVLLAAGVGGSVATWVHDLGRLRLYQVGLAQAAPKRIAPEIHAITALLTGIGAYLLEGWLYALGAFVGQLVLAYAAMPLLLDALAERLTTRRPPV